MCERNNTSAARLSTAAGTRRFRIRRFEMRRGLAAAVLGAGVTAGAMLAAQGAQGQDRPGVIGQARVFVENRGGGEAVPVVLQNVLTPAPIGVTLAGTPTVAIAPASVVQARLARQQWEYRSVALQPGQD